MKNVITKSIFLLVATCTTMAQYVDRSNFKAGLTAGIPVGDASDISSFSLGLEINHHWGVSKLFDVGVATGFINSFGETETVDVGGLEIEGEFEDFQFIPVAASVRLYPTYEFKLGGDVGYAIGVNDGNDGGFYYRPVVGYNITGNTEINVSYNAIALDDNFTFSIAMVGILFLF